MNALTAYAAAPLLEITPALAPLLPQSLPSMCRALRDQCRTAPIEALCDALDDLAEHLADDDATERYYAVMLPALTERAPYAIVPSDHLYALKNYYEPDEAAAPCGWLEPDQDDCEQRWWEVRINAAHERAEREWRSDMIRMLDAVLRVCAEVVS